MTGTAAAKAKCEFWRVGGGCSYGDNSVCACVSAIFSDDSQPEPERCLDYWRARAEKAKRELDRVHKALATMQKHEQQHLKTPCTCDGFEVCAQLLEAALAQGEGENEQV